MAMGGLPTTQGCPWGLTPWGAPPQVPPGVPCPSPLTLRGILPSTHSSSRLTGVGSPSWDPPSGTGASRSSTSTIWGRGSQGARAPPTPPQGPSWSPGTPKGHRGPPEAPLAQQGAPKATAGTPLCPSMSPGPPRAPRPRPTAQHLPTALSVATCPTPLVPTPQVSISPCPRSPHPYAPRCPPVPASPRPTSPRPHVSCRTSPWCPPCPCVASLSHVPKSPMFLVPLSSTPPRPHGDPLSLHSMPPLPISLRPTSPRRPCPRAALTRPSPVTVPTTLRGQRSRAASRRSSPSRGGRSSSALDSWYSAPQSSSTLSVGSPRCQRPRHCRATASGAGRPGAPRAPKGRGSQGAPSRGSGCQGPNGGGGHPGAL